jgi:hypothetical protein
MHLGVVNIYFYISPNHHNFTSYIGDVPPAQYCDIPPEAKPLLDPSTTSTASLTITDQISMESGYNDAPHATDDSSTRFFVLMLFMGDLWMANYCDVVKN